MARKSTSPQTDTIANAMAAMARITANPKKVKVMEVQSADFTPHYRRGDLVFVQSAEGKPSDHVVLRRRAEPPLFGVLVHQDRKSLYVKGFKAGARMQCVPLKGVAEWGRVAIAFRP